MEVKGSASLLADGITENGVHLMLSICGLKEQHAVTPSPNELGRLDGKHHRDPMSKNGRKKPPKYERMKQPTKACTEKREDCVFTWNSRIGICKVGLPRDTPVLVISTLPGNTLLH